MPTVRIVGSGSVLALATVLALGCAHEAGERRARLLPARPLTAAKPSPPARPEPGPTASPDELAWPVRGTVGSRFGTRRARHVHAGIDILAPFGTPVVAAASGRVSYSGWMRGYGNVIFVEHGRGIETRYAHLRRHHVRKGDRVERGRVIGEVGTTGNATTPHLHFELRERELARNPLPRLEPVVEAERSHDGRSARYHAASEEAPWQSRRASTTSR